MINVTKVYLPDREKYKRYVDEIYDSGWVTNQGPLLKRLESQLAERLGVKHFILVANGSLALQLIYKSLNLSGDVITTPFSFIATSSTIAWEGLNPVFVDIDKDTFNIDVHKLADKISREVSAIAPVHVFGNPCRVQSIQELADKNGLRVVYDAAHAFDSKISGRSVFKSGDASAVSFHATKLFHSIEGGGIATDDDAIAEGIRRMINFGMPAKAEQPYVIGTNAKMNEFEAAMGLCVLDDMENIHNQRRQIWNMYNEKLSGVVGFQYFDSDDENNYSYAPVLFDDEHTLIETMKRLSQYSIFPRRYFYPSLDTIDYLAGENVCPVSRDISSRIACLPMYPGLRESDVELICSIVRGDK